jgi:hypothetical protein
MTRPLSLRVRLDSSRRAFGARTSSPRRAGVVCDQCRSFRATALAHTFQIALFATAGHDGVNFGHQRHDAERTQVGLAPNEQFQKPIP